MYYDDPKTIDEWIESRKAVYEGEEFWHDTTEKAYRDFAQTLLDAGWKLSKVFSFLDDIIETVSGEYGN